MKEEVPAMENIDEHWMQVALEQARLAAQYGEVPVGAVLVKGNQLIASGFNQPIRSCDPSAHAEIVVLRAAAKELSNYRLPDTTLYVTIEPCTMCIGALIHARIKKIVFGAVEPRAGATQLLSGERFNHRIEIISGVMEEECRELIQQFFREKR